MAQLEALSKIHHRNIKIDMAATKKQCAYQRMMPVVMSEFLKLSIQYPILFTKDSETGQFVCVVLFGFEDGENLFWQDGEWSAVYTPLNVRRQPFFIGENDQKQNEKDHDYIICINIDDESVDENTGEAIFDATGKETEFLTTMQSILGSLIDGEAQTRKFIDTLLDLKLVTPISLDITFADQQEIRAEGMYSIDEEKLETLDKDTLFSLHSSDYLNPIYTMIASLGQIYALIQKKNSRLEQPSAWLQKTED